MKLACIIVFGIGGVLSRYYLGLLISRLGTTFPLGTFVINITGAFLIGMVYVIGSERAMLPDSVRVGILVGFLGGYTTFSSYALESARLFEESHILTAVSYFVLSPIIGIVAAFAGLLLGRMITGGAI